MSEQPLEYESRTTPAPRWPGTWSPRRAIATILALLAAPLLLALILPAFKHPIEDGDQQHCQSNLRQIGLAIQMYANDNKGRLPPDLATVMTSEDLTSDVFVCPSSSDGRVQGPTTQAMLQEFAKPGHCSYTLASPLPPTWNALSPSHVVAYETPGNHFGGGTNVLFGNGRCERLNDAKAAYLIAELKAGFNPPRPPKKGGGP